LRETNEKDETKVHENTILPDIQSVLHFRWIGKSLLSVLLAAAGKLIMRHIEDVTLSAAGYYST